MLCVDLARWQSHSTAFAVHCSPGKKWRRLGRERTAGGVLKLAVAGTLPVLVVQVVLAWFSKIFQSHGEWGSGLCGISLASTGSSLLPCYRAAAVGHTHCFDLYTFIVMCRVGTAQRQPAKIFLWRVLSGQRCTMCQWHCRVRHRRLPRLCICRVAMLL